jgi:transcriptional regulator with XRE-family HTH domain
VSAASGAKPAWVLHDPLQSFAQNLRVRRAELGLSQEKVAMAADMYASQYGRIERGEVDPSIRTVTRLARALQATPAELMDGVRAAER